MADTAQRLTDEKLEEMEKRLSAICYRAEKTVQNRHFWQEEPTGDSGKTTTKYTKVSWFNIENADTKAKLIVGVGVRTDNNSGAVTFAITT